MSLKMSEGNSDKNQRMTSKKDNIMTNGRAV